MLLVILSIYQSQRRLTAISRLTAKRSLFMLLVIVCIYQSQRRLTATSERLGVSSLVCHKLESLQREIRLFTNFHLLYYKTWMQCE